MPLSEALKAGVGVRDASAGSARPDWDPYRFGGQKANPAKGKSGAAGLPPARVTRPSILNQTPREPHLTPGLSDSPPTR